MAKIGSHRNIIRLREFGEGTVKKPNGTEYGAFFVVLDLASNGELYEYVANTGSLSEPTARYFFI